MRRQIASQMSMEFAPHLATPARRARRADMSRAGFIELVAGWSGGLVLVLFISALARYVG